MKIAPYVLVALISACKSPGPTTSEVKDLPALLLPGEVNAYKKYTPDQLAEMFKAGKAPAALPTGYGIGIHIIPDGTPAEVPASLVKVTKYLWKGKKLDAKGKVLRDDTLGPDLGVKARLELGTLAAALDRAGYAADASAVVDQGSSLLTDYSQIEYSGPAAAAAAPAKGWIDELRIVEEGEKPIYLGRSTYKGKFWGYLVIQVDPAGDSGAVTIPENLTLAGLKTLPVDAWEELFRAGKADETMFPSKDRIGTVVKGTGFPLIFQTASFINPIANKIWFGKNFKTELVNGVPKTMLKNQFLQPSGGIQLFDAQVILDDSRLDDGKPIILLDYRISGVPGIKAIRDEVRLVRDVTEAGVRRRLFLGPTFLLPEETLTAPAAAVAKPFEKVPVLWFALEFEEAAGSTGS